MGNDGLASLALNPSETLDFKKKQTVDTLSVLLTQAGLASAGLLAFAVDQWNGVQSPNTVVRVQFLTTTPG